ncbi:hypothetical protein LJB42_004643 [Komagataella kurtzmanii]|nr:hypothetical protein LJB42_004643 [Komagataella kurtzmanii]
MERQRQIAENRQRALEKLKQRGLAQDIVDTPAGATRVKVPEKKVVKPHSLTKAQQDKIEANRLKALELRKEHEHKAAARPSEPPKPATVRDATKAVPRNRIPSIKKSDYIEYDLAEMKDTYGGFLDTDQEPENATEKSLQDWLIENENKIVHEPAPPVDREAAPKCFECGSIELDQQLWTIFKCRVCRRCKDQKPEKYSLLTKTECKEDYLLTDPELADHDLLHRLEKTNPYSGTYSKMQLYLRYQVEEFAFKKWNGPEELDNEWAKREEQRIKRRDKKFETKLKQMRKRTRAEEYTRKLREQKYGKSHVHQWSMPIDGGKSGLVRRRCTDCGLETEEYII